MDTSDASVPVPAVLLKADPTPEMLLAGALATAQAKIKAPPKNKKVDFLDKNNRRVKYNYADLADCIAAVRDPLSENGLAVSHSIGYAAGTKLYGLTTFLLHIGGGTLESFYPLPDPMSSSIRPQEFGSALTYARRYSLCSLVGIASDDDDDGASGAETTPPPKTPTQKPDPKKAAAEAAHKAAEQKAKTPRNPPPQEFPPLTEQDMIDAQNMPDDYGQPEPDYENEALSAIAEASRLRGVLNNIAKAKFFPAEEMGHIIQRVTGRKVKSQSLSVVELQKVIAYVEPLAPMPDPKAVK